MDEKEDISKASIEITPAITDQKTPESKRLCPQVACHMRALPRSGVGKVR